MEFLVRVYQSNGKKRKIKEEKNVQTAKAMFEEVEKLLLLQVQFKVFKVEEIMDMV